MPRCRSRFPGRLWQPPLSTSRPQLWRLREAAPPHPTPVFALRKHFFFFFIRSLLFGSISMMLLSPRSFFLFRPPKPSRLVLVRDDFLFVFLGRTWAGGGSSSRCLATPNQLDISKAWQPIGRVTGCFLFFFIGGRERNKQFFLSTSDNARSVFFLFFFWVIVFEGLWPYLRFLGVH